MTNEQKHKIIDLRSQGLGYQKIGEILGVSANTISAFCKRNGVGKNIMLCKACKVPINNISGQKPKKFCCDKCRTAWWNSHQDEVQRKAVYEFTCAYCGAEFTAYGNNKRKYCSHACYIKARYSGGGACDE